MAALQQERDYGYEEVLSIAITLEESGTENNFDRGNVYAYMIDRLGAKPKAISNDVGLSPAQIRELAKVWRKFPTEESRVLWATLRWYYFRVACKTDNPEYWLNMAVDKEWSIRELEKAIRGQPVPDQFRAAERLVGKVERMLADGGEAAEYLYEHLSLSLQEYAAKRERASVSHQEQPALSAAEGGQ